MNIKGRMKQGFRSEFLLHLSYFLSIITGKTVSVPLRFLIGNKALANVIKIASPTRMADLSLTSDALYSWANLAFALQGIAREHEPTGSVAYMDVF